MSHSLVINWAYSDPVGHVIEGLQHAYGYHRANPGLEISLIVNSASKHEICASCPWLHAVHPVSLAEVLADGLNASTLRRIPDEWDFVVHNPLLVADAFQAGWDEPELMNSQPIIQRYLKARKGTGISPGFTARWSSSGLLTKDSPLPFSVNESLSFLKAYCETIAVKLF